MIVTSMRVYNYHVVVEFVIKCLENTTCNYLYCNSEANNRFILSSIEVGNIVKLMLRQLATCWKLLSGANERHRLNKLFYLAGRRKKHASVKKVSQTKVGQILKN